MSTRTARILSFARPPRCVSAPPSSPGGSGRLVTPPIRVRCELPRLPPPGRQEPAASERDEPVPRRSAEEVTAHTRDAPALEVLAHLYGRDARPVARFQRRVLTNANFLLCGRAGAIVSTIVGQTVRNAPTLQSLDDLRTYRTILGAWTRAWLVEAVRATRSYHAGLEAGLLLLRVAEQHRARLSQQEYMTHRKELYWFVLEMLDRLDQWDVYVTTWDRVRAHTAYTGVALHRHPRPHRTRPAPLHGCVVFSCGRSSTSTSNIDTDGARPRSGRAPTRATRRSRHVAAETSPTDGARAADLSSPPPGRGPRPVAPRARRPGPTPASGRPRGSSAPASGQRSSVRASDDHRRPILGACGVNTGWCGDRKALIHRLCPRRGPDPVSGVCGRR